MKKTIFAIAALAIFTVGNSFAQYPSNKGGFNKNTPVYKADNAYEEYNINQLDRIVSLTRNQQNEIKKIENRYDRIAARSGRNLNLRDIKRLELQKQQDILAVLTPIQHQRLLAYEQVGKFKNSGSRSNRRG